MRLKNIISVIMPAALVILRCYDFALAENAAGTSAYQFLELGVGARPSAMGEAFSAVSGDVNAVYWNPAGLAGLERPELSMTHALWLQDITYSNIVYGRPALGGIVGAAINRLATGNIQKADNTGTRLAESYGMSDTMGLVSYTREWRRFSFGANLKYILSRIEDENSHSYAADMGALYSGLRPWGRKLSLGLSLQNAGTKAKYVAEKNSLPVIIRAGCSMEIFRDLLVASDLIRVESDTDLHAGMEYSRAIGSLVLTARGGYKDDTVKELGSLSGLTAGLGIKWSDYQLDYAWNSFTDLGITHRFSLSIKFGRPDIRL